MRRSASGRGGRAGFSLPELMVVVAVGALLVLALQQALIGQRRFYDTQHAAAERHETVRVAMAVLGGALREADLAGGDVAILAPGRVRVRMPLGSGVVCGTDASGQRLGVVGAEGRWSAGDSVRVRRAAGWSAEALLAVDPPSARVACLAGGGSEVRLGRAAQDALAGHAARPFRSILLDVANEGGAYWLRRTDGARVELLAGPLGGAAGFAVRFEDASGSEVSDPAAAARVRVQVVALKDTLVLSFGGRNR